MHCVAFGLLLNILLRRSRDRHKSCSHSVSQLTLSTSFFPLTGTAPGFSRHHRSLVAVIVRDGGAMAATGAAWDSKWAFSAPWRSPRWMYARMTWKQIHLDWTWRSRSRSMNE